MPMANLVHGPKLVLKNGAKNGPGRIPCGEGSIKNSVEKMCENRAKKNTVAGIFRAS